MRVCVSVSLKQHERVGHTEASEDDVLGIKELHQGPRPMLLSTVMAVTANRAVNG